MRSEKYKKSYTAVIERVSVRYSLGFLFICKHNNNNIIHAYCIHAICYYNLLFKYTYRYYMWYVCVENENVCDSVQ